MGVSVLVSSYEAARSRVLECKDPECHGAQQPGSGCLFFTAEGCFRDRLGQVLTQNG